MLCNGNMLLERRLSASLCAALVLLVGSRATAQPAPVPPPAAEPPPAPAPLPTPESPAISAPAPPPAASSETLETPYEDTLPATPKAPPSAARKSEAPAFGADKRPLGPIRARRRLALLGELGWNGLAGFGAILTYHAHPHLAFDLGGGFSLTGWKAGARVRYNLLTSNMTPFIGIGGNATSGLGEFTSDPADREHKEPGAVPFTLDIKPSYFLQYVVGFDFLHHRGFNMLGALGYAQLLNDKNVILVDGELTHDEKQAVDFIFKGGIVISLAAGYAFQ